MAGRLEGKVIIVAGAGGIGSGIANYLADEGATIVVGDINGDGAERVAQEIVSRGGTAVATALDGADEASAAEIVALAVSRFGGLDGIHINFASLDIARPNGKPTDVLGQDLDDYDAAMRVNARGYLVCTRAAIPALVRRGGGSIVYTATNSIYNGAADLMGYAMSKAPILPLMRHVATRHGAEGIRANAISPGLIVHADLEAVLSEEHLTGYANAAPVKRLGRPRHIAAVSALLMSDDGDFITGQVIAVDGGAFMRP
ncbi:SDR family NAD(P)-dependent oxidoreductase [Novosphingobium sp. M1R2S20]|uniref:SDR family NAD(P)-dependent oxidoreductase n=1 Tax=Novosphingobium rhizovicinum TaxID=3228928 RepID=A0ABV3REF6_9SPHN